MNGGSDLANDNLQLKIAQFDKLLSNVKQLTVEELKSKGTELLKLLFTRDEIKHELDTLCSQKSSPQLLLSAVQQLESLDKQFKETGSKIAEGIDLVEWRERTEVDETHWWWFFEPASSYWDKLDWVWHILTVMSLALAISFMINIYSAMSMGGIAGIFTNFSTIMQGLGLAVIGGGALSKVGQEKIQNILISLNIPPKFYAEIIFVTSIVFLAMTITLNNWLDDYYLKEGKKFYSQGSLSEAAKSFERGLKVNPDNDKFNGQLGKVYESLGRLDQAIDYYMKSVEDGNFWDFNNLGRSLINQSHTGENYKELYLSAQRLAEAYLVLGLQRASYKLSKLDDTDFYTRLRMLNLLYHLRKNIGWTLMNQTHYDDALVNVKTAIKLEQKLQELLAEALQNTSNEEYKKQLEAEFGLKRPSSGMAYCLQAHLYDIHEDVKQDSNSSWETCQQQAYPEFIHELKWFYSINRGLVACKVNSVHIISGMDEDSPKNECKAPSSEDL
jgi:tetratricopeptide (TPR) repeat protein